MDVLAEGFTTYVNRRGVTSRDAVLEWALGMMNDGDTISESVTHLVGDNSQRRGFLIVIVLSIQEGRFT